jgi:DNA-binding transcriptional regulator YbjK
LAVKEPPLAAQTERRTLIADAALRLIGRVGARGLTHRAVDAEAGLPVGSTSYYCRSRPALLALALRRHAELDERAFAELDRVLREGSSSRQRIAARFAVGVSRWMKARTPAELAARFELFLAASREPTLQAVIVEARRRFLAPLSATLKAAGVRRAQGVASALIALIEGLLLERLRTGTTGSAAELKALAASLIAGGA